MSQSVRLAPTLPPGSGEPLEPTRSRAHGSRRPRCVDGDVEVRELAPDGGRAEVGQQAGVVDRHGRPAAAKAGADQELTIAPLASRSMYFGMAVNPLET
jgi:hypothetical protein